MGRSTRHGTGCACAPRRERHGRALLARGRGKATGPTRFPRSRVLPDATPFRPDESGGRAAATAARPTSTTEKRHQPAGDDSRICRDPAVVERRLTGLGMADFKLRLRRMLSGDGVVAFLTSSISVLALPASCTLDTFHYYIGEVLQRDTLRAPYRCVPRRFEAGCAAGRAAQVTNLRTNAWRRPTTFSSSRALQAALHRRALGVVQE